MKMRIGFLIMDFDKGGGTERVTSVVANHLNDRGYEVAVISARNGKKPRFKINESVDLISMESEKIDNSIKRKLIILNRLKRIVSESRIEILIAVDVTLYLYLFPLQLLKKCKCIAWEHFNFFSQTEEKSRAIARKMAAKYADALIVLSDADLLNYQRNIRNINKVVRIYNPISFDSDKTVSTGNSRFLAVGRLEVQKGFDILLSIWESVAPQLSTWTLDIIGEGSLQSELEQIIVEKNLDRVRILPFTENIVEEYLEAGVYVMTSRYEGFGLVLTEAQSVGLPIITFDCPEGPREIVENGKAGILVPFLDEDAFAKEMIKVAGDIDLRNELKCSELESSKKFNVEKIIGEWDDLLVKLMC